MNGDIAQLVYGITFTSQTTPLPIHSDEPDDDDLDDALDSFGC